MALLVYETTDPEFAERALAAMREHDIPCYRVGRGYSDSAAAAGLVSAPGQICVYIERETDYPAANQLLIGLGAVVERSIPRWVLVVFAMFAAIVAIWLAAEFNK